MEEERIGKVMKYFAKVGVAAIELTDGTLSLGDTVHIKGHTTDFQQEIESMQMENKPVQKASIGQVVGIKVSERVRDKDEVYRVIP